MFDYCFKNVLCEVSSDGEWLYMLDDAYGTVVYSWELIVADEADERAARYFGWSDEEIEGIRIKE